MAPLLITKCSTHLDQVFNDCLKILSFFPVSQIYCRSLKMKNNGVILIPNSLNPTWILLYFEGFILFALHIQMPYWIKIFHIFKPNLPQWEDSSAYRTTELQVCYQLLNTCLHICLFFSWRKHPMELRKVKMWTLKSQTKWKIGNIQAQIHSVCFYHHERLHFRTVTAQVTRFCATKIESCHFFNR